MIGNLGLDQFDKLPLWGQVLVASRLVRRRALTLPTEIKGGRIAVREVVLAACDAIEQCCVDGGGTTHVAKALQQGMDLRGHRIDEAESLGEAIWYAIDACRAAEAAYDFPVDATVTAS